MTLLDRQLTEQDGQLAETVSTLKKTISGLNQTIAEQRQIIAELREQLNKNSRNSSKPPSSDSFKKPKPKSLRQPSGSMPGGRDGHEGHHLIIEQEPKEIISHMPSACVGCTSYEKCRGTARVAETRKVADAAIDIHVTAHEALAVTCPLTGKALRGSFTEDVKGLIQYGKKLRRLHQGTGWNEGAGQHDFYRRAVEQCVKGGCNAITCDLAYETYISTGLSAVSLADFLWENPK